MSSGTPITPVDATPTRERSTPSSPATASTIASATARPCSSVATFALPLFTTTARRRARSASRETSTAAATSAFRVNSAADVASSLVARHHADVRTPRRA